MSYWGGRSLDERIPALFVIIGILLGSLYCFMLPPLQAPDEVAHFYRAYILSEGHCIAEPEIQMPEQVRHLQTLYPVHLELTRRITTAELRTLARTRLEDRPTGPVGFNFISLYSCVPYVPAAAVLTVARRLHTPPLDLMYLGRLANLATYLALVYFALRATPDFKLLLFALALMPMTLCQAASLSADSFTFAVSFLLCAYIFKMMYEGITVWDQWILAILVALVAFSKFAACLVPLVFLLPASRFRSEGRRWLFIGLQFAIAVCAVALWQSVNLSNVERFDAYSATQGIHLSGNLQLITHNPLASVTTMLRTLSSYAVLQQFVGNLGWLCVPLPAWDVLSYAILLCVIALTQSRMLQLTKYHRVVLAMVAAAGVAGIFVLIWSFNVTQAYFTEAILRGTGYVPGIQGRYFIPVALPALLMVSTGRLHVSRRAIIVLTLGTVMLSSGVALNRIRVLYYATESAARTNMAYEGELVRRPGTTPDDIKVYIVRNGVKHWITDKRWIIQNGFRWPEDVKVIPASDLDPIPSGDPFD